MATVVAATVKKGGVRTDVTLQTALADSTTLATLLGTDGVALVVDPAKIKGSLEFSQLAELLEMEIEGRANLPTDI
jgi:hypothetical protein